MKLSALKTAAATGLVSLSVLAGSMAFAATDGSAKDAAELQAFLTANPTHAKMVTDLEAKTGGKVVSAEVHKKDRKLVDLSVAMADGTEQELILNTLDGTMVAQTVHDDENANEDSDRSGDNEDDGETENENEG